MALTTQMFATMSVYARLALGFFRYGFAATFIQMALVTAVLAFGEVLFAPAQNDMAAELDVFRAQPLLLWSSIGGAMAVLTLAYAIFARSLSLARSTA